MIIIAPIFSYRLYLIGNRLIYHTGYIELSSKEFKLSVLHMVSNSIISLYNIDHLPYRFSTREEPLGNIQIIIYILYHLIYIHMCILYIVYLNGIPYVLREFADPLQNMRAFLGINSVRLEKVEERLKSDVIKESRTLGGLILVHQELCKFDILLTNKIT